jgi:hypothetical protein
MHRGRARATALLLSLLASSLAVAGLEPAGAATDDVVRFAGGPDPAAQPTAAVPVGQMPFTVYAARSAVGGSSVYVREFDGIIRIDPGVGTAQRVAGPGWAGAATYSLPAGVGHAALDVDLNWNHDFAVAPNGDLLFTIDQTVSPRIYAVDNGTQTIKVVAGNDTDGYSGDGGPATAAPIDLGNPAGGGNNRLWVDSLGRTWFLQGGDVDAFGSTFHHIAIALRRVNVDGSVTTVAGDGSNPFLGTPINAGVSATTQPLPQTPLGVTPDGTAYFVDGTHLLRLASDGTWADVSQDFSTPCEAPPTTASWFVGSSAAEWMSVDVNNSPVVCHMDLTTGVHDWKNIGGTMHDVLAGPSPVRVQETDSFTRLADGSVLFQGTDDGTGALSRCFCIYKWEAPSFAAAPPTNHPPVAPTTSVTINEDTPTSVTLAASDPDGDALTYIGYGTLHGSLSGTGANRIFTPDPNYNGPASVFYTVRDPSGATASGQINITVSPVPDKPSLLLTPVGAYEGVTFDWIVDVFDPDGQPASDYLLAVDWGDGSKLAHPTLVSFGDGSYEVELGHVYVEEGRYPSVVQVVDRTGGGAVSRQRVTIDDAPIHVDAFGIPGATAKRAWGPARVACLQDDDPLGTTGELTVTVSWGDGSSDLGKLVKASKLTAAEGKCSSYAYGVVGSHTWSKKGKFTIKTLVVDDGGARGSDSAPITVA